MKKIALSVFFCTVLAAPALAADVSPLGTTTDVDYGTGASRKLGRGVANVALGWLDIFKGVEDVGEENNFIAAVTWGPLFGAGKAVGRTLAGVYEVATFPFPAPTNFDPVVYPEFVLDDA